MQYYLIFIVFNYLVWYFVIWWEIWILLYLFCYTVLHLVVEIRLVLYRTGLFQVVVCLLVCLGASDCSCVISTPDRTPLHSFSSHCNRHFKFFYGSHHYCFCFFQLRRQDCGKYVLIDVNTICREGNKSYVAALRILVLLNPYIFSWLMSDLSRYSLLVNTRFPRT